jgi:hypothetical protein
VRLPRDKIGEEALGFELVEDSLELERESDL